MPKFLQLILSSLIRSAGSKDLDHQAAEVDVWSESMQFYIKFMKLVILALIMNKLSGIYRLKR